MDPRKPMSRRWPAVLFALVFPTLLAWLYFVVFASREAGANRIMQTLYVGGKVAQFGFPLFWLLLVDRAAPVGWGLSPRGIGLGVGFGLAVAVALLPLSESLLRAGLLKGLPDILRIRTSQLGMASPTRFLAMAAFLSLLHSGLEEYYWRGFVHGMLAKLVPAAPAIAVSSLGFMAHHVIILAVYLPGRLWTVVLPLSLCIAVGGAFWAWLHERSGSLLGPWISHALVDGSIMAVGYRLLFTS